MPRKPKKPQPAKPRSPTAQALSDPKFRPQVARDPTLYRRKQKHKGGPDEDTTENGGESEGDGQ